MPANVRFARKSGYFSGGFGPQEMQLISKLADLAIAGGGQIARAVQIGNREDEQAEAQAEYDQRLQSEIDSRQRAAQAEIAETELGGGPQAFMSDFFFSRPDAALKPSDAPDTSTLRGVTQSRAAPIVASGRMAPEDIRRFAVGMPPSAPTELPGFDVYTGRYIPPETAPDLIEPPSAPSAQMSRADILREARAIHPAGIDINAPFVREAVARASEATDIPLPGQLDELDRQDLRLRKQAIEQQRARALQQARQAMQGRDFRQEAIEAIGPAPEAKPFRMADILAAAPAARTASDRAMLLQAAASSPDIQAAGLSDLASGTYRNRAMQAVMKLFPEEERPMSELDRLRADHLRQKIATSKSLEDQRKARIKAAQDKADKVALRKARSVSGGRPDDQRVFGHLMAHRRDFQDFQEGTGRYATANIAADLGQRFGENRQYTPEEIQAERERRWLSRTGPLSGATDADREDLAMGMLSTRRSGKKYGGIVKGIKASDKKAIDQALKESKEERIAEKQETSLEFARNREQRSRSKFENELTRSERELAASRARLGIPNPKSEAGQTQFLNNYVDEQERILRGKRGGAPSAPAPSGAVYNAPTYIPGQGFNVDLTKPSEQR